MTTPDCTAAIAALAHQATNATRRGEHERAATLDQLIGQLIRLHLHELETGGDK